MQHIAPITNYLTEAIVAVAQGANIGRQARWKKGKLTATPGYAGFQYSNDLMFVGRAANGGFSEPWVPLDGANHTVAQRISADLTKDPKVCPMSWLRNNYDPTVSEYNPNISKFWQSIREVVRLHKKHDFDVNYWPSQIAWTNLYKISPADGGNPVNGLCCAQFQYCDSMLKIEIDTFKPRCVVFVTDLDWLIWFEKYAQECWQFLNMRSSQSVVGCGRIVLTDRSTPFIVTERPDSRRKGSSMSRWIDEVSGALENLD